MKSFLILIILKIYNEQQNLIINKIFVSRAHIKSIDFIEKKSTT